MTVRTTTLLTAFKITLALLVTPLLMLAVGVQDAAAQSRYAASENTPQFRTSPRHYPQPLRPVRPYFHQAQTQIQTHAYGPHQIQARHRHPSSQAHIPVRQPSIAHQRPIGTPLQGPRQNHPMLPYQPVGVYRRPIGPQGPFQPWVDWAPQYTLVPGDQLDIVVGTAPELSRTLTVGPDGRVVMPMTQPVMAAGRTFSQLQSALMEQLGKQLRDPTISVTPRVYAPEQIYIGGQVQQPGTYTLTNRIGALEALFMAGGLRPTAKGKEIAVLRRAPNGGMMIRTVNIKGGLKNIGLYDDVIQLRRGDIVYAPATGLAEVGMFVQNFRNALPVDFNLSYQFGLDNGNGTTVITP